MQFVYALINFLLLAALIYFAGGKAIKSIFAKRREKINQDLDEAETELPPEEAVTFDPIPDNATAAIEEDNSKCEAELAYLDRQFKQKCENMRLEMLLQTRSELIDQTLETARTYMQTEKFQKEIKDLEPAIADRIIQIIDLTPGDRMYIARKGELYATLCSAEPLQQETVDKLESAVSALVEKAGGKVSFQVVNDDSSLLGGLRLRIGDTLYDYTIKDRLYRLKESLNDIPIKETDPEVMLANMKKAVEQVKIDIDVFQVGRVLSVSDGICWLDGLSDIMYGEMVEFVDAKDMYGMVLDVQAEKIGCVIFGKFEHIESYSSVRRLNKMTQTPVGEELLGRVVNPIGEPIDGKGRLWNTQSRNIECPAPAILDRQPVTSPLETGIKAIDSMVPIGRGQRELIIGDRQTGKTSIAVDTIINQRGKGVYCIYVAIGQKDTSVAALVSKLEAYGAMEYTSVVLASASDSASMQYIAPFVGTAMAEHFMYNGKDVLIIYDDLSKHAVAYRELSLLLHRPSGREAYPGDIFYLHSRLLERSAKLSDELGGGSLTALPIIETQAGDISAYIPTNVISITDGQIFLETDLFNEGQRPAINVGLSVSRVGGAAQTSLMKQVSSNLRTGLAQYREYESFAQFGSDVDDATKKTLDSGRRTMAVLKQDRFVPMDTWKQALVIFAVSNGASANYKPEDMWQFESDFTSWFEKSKPELVSVLKTGKKLGNEDKAALLSAVREFGKAG